MEATNLQQEALAYFSEKLKRVEAWLQERNEIIEKELGSELQRMSKDGIIFPAITAMLNVGMRHNLEDARMYREYAENLSMYVYKLQHLDSSKAQEYLHRQSLEHRELVKHYDEVIKKLLRKNNPSASLSVALVEMIANKRACENLADDFTTAFQL